MLPMELLYYRRFNFVFPPRQRGQTYANTLCYLADRATDCLRKANRLAFEFFRE